MVKRKGRRKLKNQTSPKQISENRIAKNQILHRLAMISQRKYLPPWKNIKRCSLLLGYILLKVLPV
jgi:hypothetical protein